MSRFHLICLLSTAIVGNAVAQSPEAQREAPLSAGGIEFRFATADQARQLLSQRDRFVDQMSRFDRQVRMQSDRDPGVDAYLDFVATEAQDWPADGQAAVRRAVERLDQPLGDLSLPSLGPITFVHTTGREESGAAYTRGSMIVLPPRHTGSIDKPNRRLIAHELFHILSRTHPQLRDDLYKIIGFRFVGPIRPPQRFSNLTITNPDAPVIEHAIDVKLADGSSATIAPLLFAKSPFDRSQRRQLFGYLDFRLIEVAEDANANWAAKLVDGEPILHQPTIPDFHRQIGANTGYIIHPEEILADNFASLVTGAAVKDRWLTDEMRETLRAHSKQVDSR